MSAAAAAAAAAIIEVPVLCHVGKQATPANHSTNPPDWRKNIIKYAMIFYLCLDN